MGSVRSYRSVSAGRNEVSWRALHVQLVSRILTNIGVDLITKKYIRAPK